MLAKSQRLARDKDFAKIFKSGKSCYGKFFGIKAAANERGANRYGIIISAKVSKKAIERNKLKRQVREVIRRLDKKLISGVDLAVVVLPAALGRSFKSIGDELKMIFTKLKLLKNHD